MARNPDPKPGRWILPLVVLAMVFFTWAFVQQLEPDVIADDTPISTTTVVAGEDTGDDAGGEDTDTSDQTTPTTLPAELDTFLTGLREDQETSATIAAEMEAVNTAWDNDEAEYGETEEALVDLRDESQVFRDTVVLRVAPAGYADIATSFADAITAAEDVAAFAEDVLAGLRASDTGQLRRQALLDFRTAVEAFNQAVEAIAASAAAEAG
jgi:hypothetical protein